MPNLKPILLALATTLAACQTTQSPRGSMTEASEPTQKELAPRLIEVCGEQVSTAADSFECYGVVENLNGIEELKNLKNLSLSRTSITDASIDDLKNLPALTTLDLSSTSVGDAAIESLASLEGVRSVDLKATGFTTNGIELLKKRRPDLEIQADSPSLVLSNANVEFWSNGEIVFEGKSANIDTGEVMVGRWDISRWGNNAYKDTVEVFQFDATHRVIHLFLDDARGDEDPPRRQIVYLVKDDALIKIFDEHLGTYGDMRLTFHGDGTASYITDDWTAHLKYGNDVHEITMSLDEDSQELVVKRRVATGEHIDPEKLAACPFVWVKQGNGDFRFMGEILRNLRGKAAYASQELELVGVSGGPLVVRLTEEKDEITFLDELYLEADGVRIDASECEGEGAPVWCTSDRISLRMVRGDVLETTFQVPPNASKVVLHATGYYNPLSANATSDTKIHKFGNSEGPKT